MSVKNLKFKCVSHTNLYTVNLIQKWFLFFSIVHTDNISNQRDMFTRICKTQFLQSITAIINQNSSKCKVNQNKQRVY